MVAISPSILYRFGNNIKDVSQIFGANLKLWLDANDSSTITKTNTTNIPSLSIFYRNASFLLAIPVDNDFYQFQELPSGLARPSYTNGNPAILSGNMAITPVVFRYADDGRYARYCRFVTGITYLSSYVGGYSIAEFDFVTKTTTGGNCTVDFTTPGDGYTYATVYPTITVTREKVINRWAPGVQYVQSCEVTDNGIFDGHSYTNAGKIFEIKNDFSLTNIAQENVSEWKNKVLLTEKFVQNGTNALPWFITLSNGKKAVKSWGGARVASGLGVGPALEGLYIVGGGFLNWDNVYSFQNTWGYTANFSAGNEAIIYGSTNVVMPFPLTNGKYRSARVVNRDTNLASFVPNTYQICYGQRQIGFRQFWTDNAPGVSYAFDNTESATDVSSATLCYLFSGVTALADIELSTVFIATTPVVSAQAVIDIKLYLQSKKG